MQLIIIEWRKASEEVNIMANHLSKENQQNWSQKETQVEKKSLEKFNSITQKVKPENQNQTHNVRQEGISKINQNR
jgi:hypothetical protein